MCYTVIMKNSQFGEFFIYCCFLLISLTGFKVKILERRRQMLVHPLCLGFELFCCLNSRARSNGFNLNKKQSCVHTKALDLYRKIVLILCIYIYWYKNLINYLYQNHIQIQKFPVVFELTCVTICEHPFAEIHIDLLMLTISFGLLNVSNSKFDFN